MTTTQLCFIDTETTGLDARIHQPYEVCVWLETSESPQTYDLEHNLEHADVAALEIGRYFERNGPVIQRGGSPAYLARMLRDVTLVGSNPAFDAAMLTRFIGYAPWHHRPIDVSQGAMWLLGLDRPPGLARAAELLRDRGFEIPPADHTAEGDVRATRAIYLALDAIRDAR